jgi:N,N'-diacetyllegionaminate synthase
MVSGFAHCFLIAEAGVNHNGSTDLALDLVDAAAHAGADAVKFQTFKPERLVARGTPTAAYQASNCGASDQYEMLRALELPDSAYPNLIERCAARGIEFMSTPFDAESATMLADCGMRRIKVGSGDLTSLPFLEALAALRLPLIVSTGMATLAEARIAIDTVRAVWGDHRISRAPDALTLLHCTSNYPAKASDVNLSAMTTMARELRVPVGYSDHTEGTAIAIAAASLGARVIEKHLTLDRSLPGPDHRASLEPPEFASMVASIRSVEAALGNGVKEPAESELPVRDLVRRSVALAKPVGKGEALSREHLTLLRPGTGIPPRDLSQAIGRRVVRDLEAGTLLDWSDVLP